MKKKYTPYSKLKGWLKENGVKYSEIAELLGVNVTTVSLKINGQSDFSLYEAKVIMGRYNINREIFFADDVAYAITE